MTEPSSPKGTDMIALASDPDRERLVLRRLVEATGLLRGGEGLERILEGLTRSVQELSLIHI